MYNKTIIIAGGSGFLGQVLEAFFSKKGYRIKILTRKPKRHNEIYWDAKNLGDWQYELENSEVLINLTGKSVDCRYTSKNKKEIYNSRIQSTRLLGMAVNSCNNPPKIWFNSSTATIYKNSLKQEMTEETGVIGDDFSMNIAKSWEKAFNEIIIPKTRKVILRTAIVLGKKGGALIPLKRLAKFGLGGKQASGKQKVSWIHEIDFARAIQYIIENNLKGTFNLSVPKPTNNLILMKTLRKIIKSPFGINHPIWLIKLGAFLIGTESELVLKSRNVIPERLLTNNFKFLYKDIDIAMRDLLKNN